MQRKDRGFTVVELMIIIVVIAVLAAMTIVAYGTWRKNMAKTEVKSDLLQASNLLESVHNFKNTYPTSLYSDQLSEDDKPSFQPSENVTVILRTNATTLPHYSGLTQAQNAQLFIDACNSAMPVNDDSGGYYHTSCGAILTGIIGFLIGGAKNARLASPVQSNFTIQCTTGLLQPNCSTPAYEAAMPAVATAIKQRFTAQGGTFPVTMPLLFLGAVLPPPDGVVTYDDATTFCLDGVSEQHPDLLYHVDSSDPKKVLDGSCPA